MGKGIAGTESSLKVTFSASASSIVEFELQEIEYARNGVEIPTPEGLLVGLDFNGFYEDGGEASAVVFRVTNSVASYDLVP